jgi:hypothetical protein
VSSPRLFEFIVLTYICHCSYSDREEVRYSQRSSKDVFNLQQNVDYEARAGLDSEYATKGWVACDVHSEASSRTLDYACESLIRIG